MTPVAPAVGVTSTAVERYEDLRHGVLTGVPGGGHGGVSVLVREGVAAWLAHGTACAATARPVVHPTERPAAPSVRSELDARLVSILASMSLANHAEVHP